MNLTNPDDLRAAMRLAGIKANKNLGQHFLVDEDSLAAVMAAGELSPKDTVVEVGPGLGVMTTPMTKAVAKVIAVEMDPDLADLLERQDLENLEILRQDAMKLNTSDLPSGYKVVANIPYYITSPLIRLFLESQNQPQLMSLLVQKEVAERIVAKPGQMSVLAVSVQYYATASIAAMVERHKFWPPPKVDSAILQLKIGKKPAFAADTAKLFRLVKAGFGEKRKMLKNSLAGGFNITTERAAQLVASAKLPETARAQELSLDDWQRLYGATTKADLF